MSKPPCDSHKGLQTSTRAAFEQSELHSLIRALSLQKHVTRRWPVGGGTQKPLSQLPLQQSLEVLQALPFDVHPAAQVPNLEVPILEQVPLQHCVSFLHFFPSGL